MWMLGVCTYIHKNLIKQNLQNSLSPYMQITTHHSWQSFRHSYAQQLPCTLQLCVTGVRYHTLLFTLTSFWNVTAFQTSIHPIFSPFHYTHAKTVTVSSEQSCNHALTWCTRSSGQGVKDGQQVPGQFQVMVEVVVYAAQLESQQQLTEHCLKPGVPAAQHREKSQIPILVAACTIADKKN